MSVERASSDCEVTLRGVTVSFPLSRYLARQSWVRDDGRHTGGAFVTDSRGGRRIRALDTIDLELRSGARLGILGHNGGGKSTLLRAMMGMYPPETCKIRVRVRSVRMLTIHTYGD